MINTMKQAWRTTRRIALEPMERAWTPTPQVHVCCRCRWVQGRLSISCLRWPWPSILYHVESTITLRVKFKSEIVKAVSETKQELSSPAFGQINRHTNPYETHAGSTHLAGHGTDELRRWLFPFASESSPDTTNGTGIGLPIRPGAVEVGVNGAAVICQSHGVSGIFLI